MAEGGKEFDSPAGAMGGALESDAGPSDVKLLKLSHEICSSWRNVGIRLGLPEHELDNIDATVSLGTPQKKALKMLSKWRQYQTSPSSVALMDAVEKEKRGADFVNRQRSYAYRGRQEQGNKHVLLLAETWDSCDDSGLSIIGKQVAVEFARTERVQVSCLASEVSDESQRNAKGEKIRLCCAKGYKGFQPRERLDPPECVSGVNVIITYGRHLGKFGAPLKDKFPNSKWVHIACSKSEEEEEEEEEAEDQEVGELQYCRDADLALAIGNDAAESYECRLRLDGKDVGALTPGIYPDFGLRPFSETTDTFRVVVFYPPAVEMQASRELSIIALKAVSSLSSRSAYRLISVCAPGDDFKTATGFLDSMQKLPSSQHQMRRYRRGVENRKRLFAEVDLLILPFLPSKSDHFGLVALQAISYALPVLVTWESGIGRALRNVTHGGARIVDCDDPETWRSCIEKEKEKDNQKRHDEATALRASWEETYPWREQCDEVLERILKLDS